MQNVKKKYQNSNGATIMEVSQSELELIEFVRSWNHETISKDLQTVRRIATYHHDPNIELSTDNFASLMLVEEMSDILMKDFCFTPVAPK